MTSIAASTAIDFEGINAAALRNGRSLVQDLLPNGKFRGLEYIAKNPRRSDERPGSFSINYRSGVWKDFATDDGGSDIISFAAYVKGLSQGDAARELAGKLGVPLNGVAINGHANGHNHVPKIGPATDTPKVYQCGDDGPPRQADEVCRHVYRSGDCPLRIKIRFSNGKYVQWYRAFGADGAPIGWQNRKPADYHAIPYVTRDIDPFDKELIADEIFWPEGEKDVDGLNNVNLAGFTFGGVGDGIPDSIAEYLNGRKIVILADNDEPGRVHAEKKAAAAYAAGAAAIKILHFTELPLKSDVSDFLAGGKTSEDLTARVDGTPEWTPGPQESPEEKAQSRGNRELIIRRASEIAPEPILWLWPGRVAIGKQTLIAGEPGLGKSQLSIGIIATVTVGGLWPGSQDRAPLGRAIILSAEDDAADTIIPRLIAAGADLSRVDIISAVRNETGARRTFNLQADLALLEQYIEAKKDVRVVKIDPISSYMGAVDSHKNTDVRSVLEAVGEMAARHHVAILGITHFSKGAGQRAINAFIGSIAFIAAARAAFAVMKDPDDENRRLFLPVKNNLAPLGPGLAFRLAQHLVMTANGDTVASAVCWEDTPVTNTADGVMAASAGISAPQTAKADCIEFLETVLAHGWTSTADIAAEAVSAGLHAKAKQLRDNKPLRDARTALKVEIRREGFGKGASYFWALPGTPWVPSDSMSALSPERALMGEEGHA
jgi:putative DNA primase/helicase